MNSTHSATPSNPNSTSGFSARTYTVMAAVGAALWLAVAMLVCLTQIHDRDLGYHIAWGRLLLERFHQVRTLTLGQDPSSLIYAYSYWVYQVVVARLFDGAGAVAVVMLRLVAVLGTVAVGVLCARRLGASMWATAISLALGVSIAFERFVDRPDVLSHLFWMVAFYLLAFHRGGRGVWWLLPLQLLWANTHLYFSLLPMLFMAFVIGDALAGRFDTKRSGSILAGLLVATMCNPLGLGIWRTQFAMLRVVRGGSLPFPIMELVSPFSSYDPFLALWVFRIALPVSLILVLGARRGLGWGPVLGLAIVAALGSTARRMMSLFGVTIIALLPLALDLALRRTTRAVAAAVRIGVLVPVLLVGVVGVVGLVNGRIYLAQDKSYRIGALHETQFPASGAARFVHDAAIAGPLFHNPESAGALLMENGIRLSPFLDARWVGTPDAIQVYHELTQMTDETIANAWTRIQSRYAFEAVMLDAYAMSALLRHLDSHAEWSAVFVDAGAILFCHNKGKNEAVITRYSPAITPNHAATSQADLEALSEGLLRSLSAPRASMLAAVVFPWDDFQLANLAMQRRNRHDAVIAYAEFFRKERGSLAVSSHRKDILNNVLWCLTGSGQASALETLCGVIANEETDASRRRGLTLMRAQALVELKDAPRAVEVAQRVITDPGATASDQWWGWCAVADARRVNTDYSGSIAALESAARILPKAPSAFRAMGKIYDENLGDRERALQAYRMFQSLGGKDPFVEGRIQTLETRTPSEQK